MAKRGYGTGHLYEKHGSYYGRWWTLDGRRVNRLIGPIRPPGSRTGLTLVQAERIFRQLQDHEEKAPRRRPGATVPTVDEVADSVRQGLRLKGSRRSYLDGLRVDAARSHLSAARASLGRGDQDPRNRCFRRVDAGD